MAKSNETGYLSIGAVAAQVGIRTSALRYYESIGLLPAPKRINGRRCYEESILQRLALVQLAQKAGFTMNEIHELLHGFSTETLPAERWQTMAHKKLAEIEQMVARAQQMKQILEMGLRCGCLRLEDCVIVMGMGCQQPGTDERCDRPNAPLVEN
jgi:MerR family transcriptional regulator, redox-sensitive transcriptional activator SoxR